MRPAKDESCYVYIVAVYVEDLAIAAKDANHQLQHKPHVKRNRTTHIYQLGQCVHQLSSWDTCGRSNPKILESYDRALGSKPNKVRPPLEESDHPELHIYLSSAMMSKYQTLICQQLMCTITLGRKPTWPLDISSVLPTTSLPWNPFSNPGIHPPLRIVVRNIVRSPEKVFQ